MKKKLVKKKKLKKSNKFNVGDIASILNFYGNFDIPLPGYLSTALGEYLGNRNKLSVEKLKIAQARSMVESTHPALADQIFLPMRAASKAFLDEINKETYVESD